MPTQSTLSIQRPLKKVYQGQQAELALQVELYADYEPGRLMSFLVSSQAYGLEAAAELCEHRGLVREQVFVLGRMGNARQALELIISKLADIPQVPSCPCLDFIGLLRC